MNALPAHLLGSIAKTRPALLRWADSPPAKLAIASRWIVWLTVAWPTTTLTTLAALGVVTAAASGFVIVAVLAGLWAGLFDRRKTTAALIALAAAVGAIWVTWTAAAWTPFVLLAPLVGLVVDVASGLAVPRVRRWRWWCEFRRGWPARYALMALKAHQIQSITGGERQPTNGQRAILDHPALGLKPTWDGHTAWITCSVPPGRSALAFEEVRNELAASFVRVHRIDTLFTDPRQTYGYLAVTFGPPRRPTTPNSERPTARVLDGPWLSDPDEETAA